MAGMRGMERGMEEKTNEKDETLVDDVSASYVFGLTRVANNGQ